MASNDQMALQGRLSVDQAVRSLEGKPFYKDIGPKILVLTPNNLKSFQLENSLSPAGFRPVYSVNDQATSEPVNK